MFLVSSEKNRTNGSSGTTNRGALEYSDHIA